MRIWLTAAGFAFAFVLAGVFFATRRSLGDADQYASVGSFLLALATLGGTAVVAARRAPQRPARDSDEDDARASRYHIGTIEDVGNVIIGDRTSTTIHQDNTPRRRTERDIDDE